MPVSFDKLERLAAVVTRHYASADKIRERVKFVTKRYYSSFQNKLDLYELYVKAAGASDTRTVVFPTGHSAGKRAEFAWRFYETIKSNEKVAAHRSGVAKSRIVLFFLAQHHEDQFYRVLVDLRNIIRDKLENGSDQYVIDGFDDPAVGLADDSSTVEAALIELKQYSDEFAGNDYTADSNVGGVEPKSHKWRERFAQAEEFLEAAWQKFLITFMLGSAAYVVILALIFLGGRSVYWFLPSHDDGGLFDPSRSSITSVKLQHGQRVDMSQSGGRMQAYCYAANEGYAAYHQAMTNIQVAYFTFRTDQIEFPRRTNSTLIWNESNHRGVDGISTLSIGRYLRLVALSENAPHRAVMSDAELEINELAAQHIERLVQMPSTVQGIILADTRLLLRFIDSYENVADLESLVDEVETIYSACSSEGF